MKSLIDILDLSVEEIDGLISVANDIIKNPEKYSPVRKPFEYTPGSDLICAPYSFNIYIFSLK